MMLGTPPVFSLLAAAHAPGRLDVRALSFRVLIGFVAALAGALLKYTVYEDAGALYIVFLPFALIASFTGGMTAGVSVVVCTVALVALLFVPVLEIFSAADPMLFAATSLSLPYVAAQLRPIRAARPAGARQEAGEMRAASQHLQIAISSASIGAWDLDLRTNIAANVGDAHKIFGFSKDRVVTPADIYDLVLPDDLPAMQAAMRTALEPGGSSVYRAEYRIRRASDGEIRWLRSEGQAIFEGGAPRRVVGVTLDLTDERAATQALLERAELAERFASVAAAAPGVIFSICGCADGDRACPFVSEKAKSVFGIDDAELMRDAGRLFERIHPDDRAPSKSALQKSARRQELWEGVFRYDHPEKGEIWIDAQAAPVRQKNGDVVWHGYACDITDRKLSELAIEKHAASMQAIIDGAREGIFTLDIANRIVSANDAGLAMFGCRRSEMVGDDLFNYLAQTDETALQRDAVVAAKGRRANGDLFPVELVGRRACLAGAMTPVVFISDLSERDRSKRRIEALTVERLSAIGAMAKILGHQINQPLTAGSAYLKVAQRLLERLPPESGAQISETIGKAVAQMLRAGEVVRNLRELVAHEEPDKTLVSLSLLIEEALSLVGAQASDADVSIEQMLATDNDLVVADRAQLKRVLANLLRNAIEAMRGSARRELLISMAVGDGTISVEISDTGRGLEGIDRTRLFEPFDAASPRGMGIGLPISRAIVEAHYGRIWARPKPGGGAVFGFNLPLPDRESNS